MDVLLPFIKIMPAPTGKVLGKTFIPFYSCTYAHKRIHSLSLTLSFPHTHHYTHTYTCAQSLSHTHSHCTGMALQGFKSCGGRPTGSHAEVLSILAKKLPGWSSKKEERPKDSPSKKASFVPVSDVRVTLRRWRTVL